MVCSSPPGSGGGADGWAVTVSVDGVRRSHPPVDLARRAVALGRLNRSQSWVPQREGAFVRIIRSSLGAIGRARMAILSVGVVYIVTVAIGIGMVNAHIPYALDRRDAVVASAQGGDIALAYRGGDRLRAALLDFAANLGLGGVTSTVLGITVVGAYPVFAYRGWVGGVVSVDAQHRSRLDSPDTALYYLVTLVLQLIPYSIAGGVGVRLGLGAWRDIRGPHRPTVLGLRRDRLRDAALAYVVIAPLFLVASLWEYFA